MKIAIIGSSHTGAIRLAHDQALSDGKTMPDLTFFVARSHMVLGLEVAQSGEFLHAPEGSELEQQITYTSGGRGVVDASYDAYVICGLASLPVYERRASSALLDKLKAGYTRWSGSTQLVHKLRKITDAPILATVVPYPAYPVFPLPSNYQTVPHATRTELYQKLSKDVLGVDLLGQPSSTVVKEAMTDHKFTRQSARVDVGDVYSVGLHPTHDFTHMNTEYGSLVLDDICDWVASLKS